MLPFNKMRVKSSKEWVGYSTREKAVRMKRSLFRKRLLIIWSLFITI